MPPYKKWIGKRLEWVQKNCKGYDKYKENLYKKELKSSVLCSNQVLFNYTTFRQI